MHDMEEFPWKVQENKPKAKPWKYISSIPQPPQKEKMEKNKKNLFNKQHPPETRTWFEITKHKCTMYTNKY